MTKKEARELVNESLIDQDTKFTREINALFKQQEPIDLLQQAYDMSDDNAKMSLMDATEKQFLDKFAADGSGDDDEKSSGSSSDDSTENDDFEEDGSDLDFEEDGSDFGGSDDFSTQDDGGDQGGDDFFGGDDSNPFSDMGGGDQGGDMGGGAPVESSNPFESRNWRNGKYRPMNESKTIKRKITRRKHKK